MTFLRLPTATTYTISPRPRNTKNELFFAFEFEMAILFISEISVMKVEHPYVVYVQDGN